MQKERVCSILNYYVLPYFSTVKLVKTFIALSIMFVYLTHLFTIVTLV